MWNPIKLKQDTRKTSAKLVPGWYCHDDVSSTVDLGHRYTGKQSAQKACDRLNTDESAARLDGKTRNQKRWYTVGYATHRDLLTLVEHHLDYLSPLLRKISAVMREQIELSADVAIVWPGKLSRQEINEEIVRPIRHVLSNGQIATPAFST